MADPFPIYQQVVKDNKAFFLDVHGYIPLRNTRSGQFNVFARLHVSKIRIKLVKPPSSCIAVTNFCATINQWCVLGILLGPAIRWSDPGLPHQMSNHRTARGPQDPIFRCERRTGSAS